MSSFDKINYDIRVNKSIERKLILDSLLYMGRAFDIADYRYVGFASLWFSDFVLFHKVLNIQDMLSIEVDEIGFKRQQFNKPYHCIKLKYGHSNIVLAKKAIFDKKTIIWLDYDGDITDMSELVADVENVCALAKSGSVLLVTLNAHPNVLKDVKDSSGLALDKVGAFNYYMGKYAPVGLKPKDVNPQNYPITLIDSLESMISEKATNSGRKVKYKNIYKFSYKDGSPMITIGGMIGSRGDLQKLSKLKLKSRHAALQPQEAYEISVPPLTKKEQKYINGMLPSGIERKLKDFPPDINYTEVGNKSLVLLKDGLRSYIECYRQYPAYGEVQND
jgi:hypothetical protein